MHLQFCFLQLRVTFLVQQHEACLVRHEVYEARRAQQSEVQEWVRQVGMLSPKRPGPGQKPLHYKWNKFNLNLVQDFCAIIVKRTFLPPWSPLKLHLVPLSPPESPLPTSQSAQLGPPVIHICEDLSLQIQWLHAQGTAQQVSELPSGLQKEP